MPARTSVTGVNFWPTVALTPLAAKLPTARGNNAKPVWKALYPVTFCNQSGRLKMMPNSPTLTMAAAMLPLRKEGMENRLRSSIAGCFLVLRPHSTRTKVTSAATPIVPATAEAETAKGHVHPNTTKSPVARNHP